MTSIRPMFINLSDGHFNFYGGGGGGSSINVPKKVPVSLSVFTGSCNDKERAMTASVDKTLDQLTFDAAWATVTLVMSFNSLTAGAAYIRVFICLLAH